MAHPTPTRFMGLAAALESTGGTPETINLATDAIQLAEPTMLEGPFFVHPNRREGVVAASLNIHPAVPAAPGGRYYRLPFRCELRGAGAAYSASSLPEADPLIVAAGFSRTITTTSGSESVQYDRTDTPSTGTDDTLTVQVQQGNREYVLTNGVVEEPRIECDAGGIAYFAGTIWAKYSTDTEQAVEAHTYSTVSPAIWQNATPLDIGGVTSIVARRVVASWGWRTVVLPAPDATGIDRIQLMAANPMLQLTARTVAKSTWDPEDDMTSVTSRTIDVHIGGTQYERVKLDYDRTYVDNVAKRDEDDHVHFEVDYGARVPTSGNESSILFD